MLPWIVQLNNCIRINTAKIFFTWFHIVMKISFNNIYNPQFKSYSAVYKTSSGKEIGTFTRFFREDLSWEKFVRYQLEHFKDKERVNIVQFGASDGSEAFTHIMSLLEFSRGENVEKFFPISAYDLNSGMVKLASGGYINIYNNDDNNDEDRMNDAGISIKKYFTKPQTEPPHFVPSSLFSVKNSLRKRVNFIQGDMFELLPKLQDNSDTILMCRNCLGYFPEKMEWFVQTASKVLKAGSLFAVGHLEQDEPYFDELLKRNNFQKIMNNVYQKL